MKGTDLLGWLGFLALVPLSVLLLSCFVKVAVVLSLLRTGLGGRGVWPGAVTVALALLFALFVMAPVGEKMWSAMEPGLKRGDAEGVRQAEAAASEPLREFLFKRTPARERQTFLDLQRQLRPAAEAGQVGERDLVVLAPAFVVTELRLAFQIAFLLLLPFLVLDLVVASILGALGMHGLEPRAVSLPLKLLLFVLADGWHLLMRGLLLGYT